MTQHKKKLWKFMPVVRVIGVLSAVGIATTLVTFAAIQSTGNALTGNTIQTATALLQISTTGSNYTDSVPGFNFTGLVPGGSAQPVANNYTVYLKNAGSAALNLSLTVPTPPTVVPDTVDLAKVTVWLTPPSVVGMPTPTTQKIPLADLIAGKVSLDNGVVAQSATITYRIQVAMAADAVTGNGATISGLNLSFSGSPVVQ
jgi:hypothetical protein